MCESRKVVVTFYVAFTHNTEDLYKRFKNKVYNHESNFSFVAFDINIPGEARSKRDFIAFTRVLVFCVRTSDPRRAQPASTYRH